MTRRDFYDKPDDFATHIDEIELSREAKSNNYRLKKSKKAKADARAKKLARWMKNNGYTNKDLRAKLARDRMARHVKSTTPHERSAVAKVNAARRAVKRRFCDHKKLPPKKRLHGKHAGLYVCPSCNNPVPLPAVVVNEGDLVV